MSERLAMSASENVYYVTNETVDKVRAFEVKKGRRWIEKELTRLIHSWQGISRSVFNEEKRPDWWVPGEVVHFGETATEIPLFQSRRKIRWTQDAMRCLVARAYQMIDCSVVASTVDPSVVEMSLNSTRPVDDLSAPIHGSLVKPTKENASVQILDPSVAEDFDAGQRTCAQLKTPESARRAEKLDSEDIDTIIAEMEVEVQARCDALRSLAEQVALSLQNAFSVEVLKLPRRVRGMSVRQFYENYAGDVDAILMHDIRKTVEESIAMESSKNSGLVRTDNKRRRARLETATADGLATGRVRRTRARYREALQDASNSQQTKRVPQINATLHRKSGSFQQSADLLVTPAQPKKKDVVDMDAPGTVIQSIRRGKNGKTRIELDDGHAIEVSDGMNAEAKSVARMKLVELQHELQSLIAELNG
ncbi:hypothetical protein NDN08_006709 [Rhodosorus marinus]|uniref:Borealin N-terminal domain-containing protein n=1 Tax=Rhodosorus marinus TaxID=101924 RepID=A0AAV8UMC8_9RHOD|nr:hypothetical protein NDN08_006709 [Rhodosorus marinus]